MRRTNSTLVPGGEYGFGLAEVMVTMVVLSVALLGLVGVMASNLRYVGLAQQRQAAAAAGQTAMEEIRRLSYENVAMRSAPIHEAEQGHPDHALSVDGTLLDVSGEQLACTASGGTCETLHVDPASGLIDHTTTRIIGPTTVTVYGYVTWVDDPDITTATVGRDYKRVTLVAAWEQTQVGSVADHVRLETFVGAGLVLPEHTPGPSASPTTAPTPAPGPSPSPGTCPGDSQAPAGSISLLTSADTGATATNSRQITVRQEATDTCPPLFGELSNDGVQWGSMIALTSGSSTDVSWTLTEQGGAKTVYARFTDGNGTVSGVSTASIVLDQDAPHAPANFRVFSCAVVGADRSALFTWDPVADADGYRLYRSDSGGPYAVVQTVSALALSVTDVAQKTLAVTYVVRAYDTAGNESPDSDAISIPKNACV